MTDARPAMPPSRWWRDLTTEDFRHLDADRTVAILPVAAIEQHGPHLPLSTDTTINDGLIAEFLTRIPDDLPVLVLPTQQVGKSDEHLSFPGTLSIDAETLIRAWRQIGEGVAAAGLRKLIIMNSHGGQPQVVEIVARDLRILHRMLAVVASWSSMGKPDGLFTRTESRFGFHAGDIETSLMLHLRPDLVRMDLAENFETLGERMTKDYEMLRPEGRNGFAWMAEDLNPKGPAGNASAATADKGRRLAAHQTERFATLVAEVSRFPLDQLAPTP